jgi:ribosomal protein S3AE
MAKEKQKKAPKLMKQKAKSKKGVKKTFFEVSAPITSTKIQLYTTSAEDLDGKTIKLDLTKILRGKSLELKLRIKTSEGKIQADPESIELMNAYIRRVMRKGTDYCEDSFETECRDYIVRVKPLLIARKRVSRAILKALRDSAKKTLEAHIKTRSAKEIFQEITTNKLQKQLSLKLKKIYPLALCEIRMFKIIKPLEKKKEDKKDSEKEE